MLQVDQDRSVPESDSHLTWYDLRSRLPKIDPQSPLLPPLESSKPFTVSEWCKLTESERRQEWDRAHQEQAVRWKEMTAEEKEEKKARHGKLRDEVFMSLTPLGKEVKKEWDRLRKRQWDDAPHMGQGKRSDFGVGAGGGGGRRDDARPPRNQGGRDEGRSWIGGSMGYGGRGSSGGGDRGGALRRDDQRPPKNDPSTYRQRSSNAEDTYK